MSSIDVFAATNPAFCGLIMWSFLERFGNGPDGGCELPLAFLPLPIVLSEELSALFAGTNSTTGYLTWLGRHPEIAAEFAPRMQRTVAMTRQAVVFCLRYSLVRVNEAGRLEAVDN